MIKKAALYLALLTTLTLNADAIAQTAIAGQGKKAPMRPNQVRSVQTQNASVPVSKKVVQQAKDQIDGKFGTMDRSTVGGQIQPVWDETQPTEGFFQYNECTDCVYKVRIREYMVTTIILPKGISVHSFDIGDPVHFHAKQRADNILAVQAAGGGVDSNLTIYTTEGDVYPFYLRAEGFNSNNVPDLVIKINGSRLPKAPIIKTAVDPKPLDNEETQAADKPADDNQKSKKEEALEGLQKKVSGPSEDLLRAKGKDFVENVGFDPDKLRGWDDYELWGDDELRPEMVFRDDHFTYIKYGKNWNDMDLPTAYVVVDGIDELVNTRVQGTTFIIESTKKLISLKSGKKYLCLSYEGTGA